MSDGRAALPAYNAAAWIGQTLQSIRAQTYPRWQAIVADDASRDGTDGVVLDFAAQDPRIRHLRMAVNTGGPAGPRNAALALCTTKWVAFCDADDVWQPEKLQLQLQVER